jgi:hypothetical protein
LGCPMAIYPEIAHSESRRASFVIGPR